MCTALSLLHLCMTGLTTSSSGSAACSLRHSEGQGLPPGGSTGVQQRGLATCGSRAAGTEPPASPRLTSDSAGGRPRETTLSSQAVACGRCDWNHSERASGSKRQWSDHDSAPDARIGGHKLADLAASRERNCTTPPTTRDPIRPTRRAGSSKGVGDAVAPMHAPRRLVS
jgi:hypothetical protein